MANKLQALSLKGIKLTISYDETINGESGTLEVKNLNCIVFVDSDVDTSSLSASQNYVLTRKPFISGVSSTNISANYYLVVPRLDITDKEIWVYGFIKLNSSELTLLCNYGDIDILQNNIEITFPSFDEENDKSSYINRCTFGILYSDQYSQNRLIVSGNPDVINCDWWTDDINVYAHQDDVNVRQDLMYNDLTYFPDENFCYYGGDQAKVIGYDVDENGKLIVFKENFENEPTIYFREGAQIYNNKDGSYTYKLNMFSGNAGAYPLNNKVILNFAGRTIFLSNEKNVAILLSTDALKDKGKYAISASVNIDAKLKQFSKNELEKAIFYSDEKFLYFAIGSVIFVARYDELSTSTYQYEWYVLDTDILNEDEYISTFVKRDDDVLFATNLGKIFVIKNEVEEIYEDNRKVWLTSGDFNEKVFMKSLTDDINENDLLKTSYYLRFNNLTNGEDLTITNGEIIETNNEEALLFLQYLYDTDREVYLIEKENPLNSYEIQLLYDDIAKRFYVKNATFSDDYALAIVQSDSDLLKIATVDEEGYYTLIYEVSEKISRSDVDLVNFEPSYEGYVEHVQNVNAVYVTAPFHMNTLDRYKNIYSYTLTNDTRKKSEIILAIISNSIPFDEAKMVGNINDIFGFSLSLFDFTSMSLAQDYIAARSYTKYRNIVRQRFTDFVFFNKNNTNAVLSNMSIVYTINNSIVGGD